MRVKFTKDYDHTWPSRAMTNYPAGLEMTVKREVGEAAKAAGAAEILDKASDPADRDDVPEKLPGNLSVDLADPQALTPNNGVDASPDSK